MKEGEKSIVSTNKRAADEIIESSAKRPKQALGEGGENKIDNQSAVEDEQKNLETVKVAQQKQLVPRRLLVPHRLLIPRCLLIPPLLRLKTEVTLVVQKNLPMTLLRLKLKILPRKIVRQETKNCLQVLERTRWKREKNPLHPQTKEVPMKQLNQVQRDQNRFWAKEEKRT